ncbi:recQ-like DNA helicase BLM [Patella vulgata]|uniref:recQ-like DNA helicase BLM n=1 Tax=Patella vulgata TaxID=6465 RepID=UPI00217FBD91|nr:recQ-like DNA helicase BLM [Patella vulgata]XP_050402457.1 recQ-like DNA helicase BLM [Patella vulgata]
MDQSGNVKKGGFTFKRSSSLSTNKVRSINQPPPTLVNPFKSAVCHNPNVSNKSSPNQGTQTSIKAFTNKVIPVAAVPPHRSPIKTNAPSIFNNNLRIIPPPTNPVSSIFIDEDDDDDFDFHATPSQGVSIPPKAKPFKFTSNNFKIKNKAPTTTTRAPSPPMDLDDQEFNEIVSNIEVKTVPDTPSKHEQSGESEEEEEMMPASKRRRHDTRLDSDDDTIDSIGSNVQIVSDASNDAAITVSDKTSVASSGQLTNQSETRRSIIETEVIPLTDVSQHPLLKLNVTQVEDNDMCEMRYLLLSVTDEICDIVGKFRTDDLMSAAADDYDRLQKLLYIRKQVKEKGKNLNQPVIPNLKANRPDVNKTVLSKTTTVQKFDPPLSPVLSTSRNNSFNFSCRLSDTAVGNKSLVTSTAVKKTSVSRVTCGADSPIPCGDSFFEDDMELGNTQMTYMKGFKKPSSSSSSPSLSNVGRSPRNSTSPSANISNRTLSRSTFNTSAVRAPGLMSSVSVNSNNSCNNQTASMFNSVNDSTLTSFSPSMNDTSNIAQDFQFDYSISRNNNPAVACSSGSNPQPTSKMDEFDSEMPDEYYAIEDFLDLEDEIEEECGSMSTSTTINKMNSSLSKSVYKDTSVPSLNVSTSKAAKPALGQVDFSDDYNPSFAATDKDDGAEFDGQNFPHSRDMYRVFRQTFGLKDFRRNQLQAMNAALLGKDTFILMPTGGGKSLCYQLPALVTNGVSVVISPLRALIQDQVQRLRSLDIRAASLSGDIDLAQSNQVYNLLYQREPGVQLLYVTPEKVSASTKLLSCFEHLYNRQLLDRFVIDEAHCVSQWGHDFRPDYKKLNLLRSKYRQVPMMALTATATPRVRKDIIHQLGMNDPKWFMQSFNRSNLKYLIKLKKPKAATKELQELIQTKFRGDIGVVYCLSRKECDNVASDLQKAGIQAVSYHAGLSDKQRFDIQEQWLYGDSKVICATIAFGMGIDKPDVRFVVHYSLPKSVEGYYQEAGRAGRDGHLAHCILFYNYSDVKRLRTMIQMDQNANYESKRVHLDNLFRMVAYCENVTDCRRSQILQYFGEHYFDRSKCNEYRGSVCDNCESKDSFTLRDVTDDAKVIVQAVQDLASQPRNKLTLLHFVELIKGSQNTKIMQLGHNKHKAHGICSAYSRQDAERLMRKLVIDGILMEDLQVTAMDMTACYIRPGMKVSQVLNGAIKVELQIHTNRKKLEMSKIGQEPQSDREKLTSECYKELLPIAKAIAREHGVFNYATIFTNTMLWQMAEKLPTSEEEMIEQIDLITSKKIQTYKVDRLLQVLANYKCLLPHIEDDRVSSNNKEDDDDMTSPYFNTDLHSDNGGGRRGAYGKGKKNFKRKRGGYKKAGGGKAGYKKAAGGAGNNSKSSFSQFKYKKKTPAKSKTSATTTSRPAANKKALGMMPVPQNRSFMGGGGSFMG